MNLQTLRNGKQLLRWLSAPRVLNQAWRKSRRIRFYRSTWQTTFCILQTPRTFPSMRRSERHYRNSRPEKFQQESRHRRCGRQWPAGEEGLTATPWRRAFRLSTVPTAGLAIADTVRQAAVVTTFEILKSDGTQVGFLGR